MSKNANLQLTQYKVIHRTHLTGQKLDQHLTRAHCIQNTTDSYIHTLWHCTPVYHFWKQVTDSLSAFLGRPIPLSPSLCLLGDTSSISINPSNKLLLVALTVAKKTILMNWKFKKKITLTMKKLALRPHLLGTPVHIH